MPAGDNVLALGAAEVFPVGHGRPVQGVAAEQYAGAALFVEVTEHHELNGHSRAQCFRDAVMLSVTAGAARVPGIEYRLHGSVQLAHGVAGNGLPGIALNLRPPIAQVFAALQFGAIRPEQPLPRKVEGTAGTYRGRKPHRLTRQPAPAGSPR